MRTNFETSLGYVLGHEGGFSNHWNDAGGATNHGIIQRVYDSYRRRRKLVPRSVKSITKGELFEIYKEQYWDQVRGDDLPPGIDYCVFDAAVNSGPRRGIRWLQNGINKVAKLNRVKVDETIGNATLDAADDYDLEKLVDAMLDYRLGFMKIARNTNTGALLWPSFGRGWTNRLYGFLPRGAKEALRQANGVDDHAKKMIREAGVSAQPQKYPLPEVPSVEKRPVAEVPGWLLALLAALAMAFGVYQWQL